MAKLDPYEKTERRQDVDAEREAQAKRRSRDQEKTRREWEEAHGVRDAELPREPDGSVAPTPQPYGPPADPRLRGTTDDDGDGETDGDTKK